MNLLPGQRKGLSPESITTLSIAATITLVSIFLMLACASPELSWDEASYSANTTNSWSFLRGRADYDRHYHGPMSIYLAKLGQQILPAGAVSIENRSRFFDAAAGSLAVGLLYWALRRCFDASRPAALAGSGLLLLSVIRLEETNVIGPHNPALPCILAIVALGYRWRDQAAWRPALGLGVAMGLGALSMTYIIPAALCWAMAVGLAGKDWFSWDRTNFKVSWAVPVMFATAAIVVLVLWPPGVLRHSLPSDFRSLAKFGHHPTIVGNHIYEATPRWAVLYWLARFDAPILGFSAAIISLGLWAGRANGRLSAKGAYLSVFLAFFLATLLTAYIAGARNLLFFIAVLCLATGALFDEALGRRPLLAQLGCVAIVTLAGLNLARLSRSASYTPSLATDGYRAFLRDNRVRLAEKAKALVFGMPNLAFYAQQSGTPIGWETIQMPWTTRADAPLPEDARYALIPSLVCSLMPQDQPMRRVVTEHWRMLWSFKSDRTWELRLYEKPPTPAP
jgi:hypothetical protein